MYLQKYKQIYIVYYITFFSQNQGKSKILCQSFCFYPQKRAKKPLFGIILEKFINMWYDIYKYKSNESEG